MLAVYRWDRSTSSSDYFVVELTAGTDWLILRLSEEVGNVYEDRLYCRGYWEERVKDGSVSRIS